MKSSILVSAELGPVDIRWHLTRASGITKLPRGLTTENKSSPELRRGGKEGEVRGRPGWPSVCRPWLDFQAAWLE